MSVDNKHPSYTAMFNKWTRAVDSYEGEDAIKAKGTNYLPATAGQKMDGQGTTNSQGELDYLAYKQRAVYPALYGDAVEAIIGIMHREPPKIELPSKMEFLRENCTLLGEDLEMLLCKINIRQVITGRLGLLADIRNKQPVILIYNERAIINWNDTDANSDSSDLNLVVLNESTIKINEDFAWNEKEQYRVLALTDSVYGSASIKAEDLATTTISSLNLEIPHYMGSTIDRIPFTFINTKDLSPLPDNPPLDDLARLCLTIYRTEADYRQNLHMQAQDTLVRVGALDDEEVVRTGAGARIDVPINGDAKFIGVSSSGLPEQRTCLENDYARANQKSGQLIDAISRVKESGDALRIRMAAQAATLPQLAKTGAAGLESILKDIAVWIGANPEDVVVTPNLNFSKEEMDGEFLIKLVQAKTIGAPISKQSIFDWMVKQGFTERTIEEELALIQGEGIDL